MLNISETVRGGHTVLQTTDTKWCVAGSLEISKLPDVWPTESSTDNDVDRSSTFKVHCPKNVSPFMFDNNFGKCGPTFKIFSTIDS